MNVRHLHAGGIVLAILTSLNVAACNGKRMAQTSALEPTVPQGAISNDLQKVAGLRIAFGHQSVGSDILKGIDKLASEAAIQLQILESQQTLAAPGIHHFRIGKNELPATKMKDFDAIMRGGVASSADVAIMKFCFLDLNGSSDPNSVAHDYIVMLDQLSASFPQTIFVPVTVPLTTVQTGPKAWIKRAIGRTPSGLADNAQRAEFNAAIRHRYGTDGTLFDIAAFESGSGATHFKYREKSIEALDPSITYDGAHLNEAGERRLGAALLRHLATLTNP